VDVKISFKITKTSRKNAKNQQSTENEKNNKYKMQAIGSLTLHLTCQRSAHPPCPMSDTPLCLSLR